MSQEENQDRMLSLNVDDEEVCCTTDTSGRGPGHFLAISRGSQEIATGLNRPVSKLRNFLMGNKSEASTVNRKAEAPVIVMVITYSSNSYLLALPSIRCYSKYATFINSFTPYAVL